MATNSVLHQAGSGNETSFFTVSDWLLILFIS